MRSFPFAILLCILPLSHSPKNARIGCALAFLTWLAFTSSQNIFRTIVLFSIVGIPPIVLLCAQTFRQQRTSRVSFALRTVSQPSTQATTAHETSTSKHTDFRFQNILLVYQDGNPTHLYTLGSKRPPCL